jgi:hypothetical protein
MAKEIRRDTKFPKRQTLIIYLYPKRALGSLVADQLL